MFQERVEFANYLVNSARDFCVDEFRKLCNFVLEESERIFFYLTKKSFFYVKMKNDIKSYSKIFKFIQGW